MSFLVLVERASGLRSADFMGKSDPYVNLVCGSSKYQTGIIDNNLNPVWDEMFLIHTQPGAERLDFVLFDSDAGTHGHFRPPTADRQMLLAMERGDVFVLKPAAPQVLGLA